MNKTIATLLAGVAGIATIGAAQASPAPATPVQQPMSYADLLAPIPNAAETLKADDMARAQQQTGGVKLAQYYRYYGTPYYYGTPNYYGRYYYYHHHHHHHHHHYRRD